MKTAEEIIKKYSFNIYPNRGYLVNKEDAIKAMQDFAAQQVAEVTKDCYPKEFVIAFTDWLDKLQPSQRVSVWSKNGEYKGLFTMDNEQLLENFKERVWKENVK